jgi:hypothetical protein
MQSNIAQVNANADSIRVTITALEGACNVKLLNEVADAINKIARRYEAQDIEFDYSNYVMDKEGNAIW